MPGTSRDETPALQRATLAPRQDFVVLPLGANAIRAVCDYVSRGKRFLNDVIHVQVEKQGVLQFGAYDNFHPDCIVIGPAVTKSALDELMAEGVLRSVRIAQSPRKP